MTKGIRGKRLLFALLVVFLIAVVPSVVVPTLMCRRPDPVLDDLGPLPAFTLVDERGKPFTDEAFRGHASIVNFVFTRCDTICPVTTMTMARLQEHMFDVKHRVKIVSITVDPAYDTPEKLAAYAKIYRADPDMWRFVTGDPAVVKALVEGAFANNMERDGDTATGTPNIAHTGHFALVDPAGHLRGLYESRDIAKLDALMRDARFVSRTMRKKP